ncbi:pseudouridine synthase [Patescibacteria group bacterium]|nr:pseudouridine synthase [Patescibacteria group bacterium]
MRINKYLALHNYATRRGADELISKGKVFLNGSPAQLGDQVEEGDTVEVKTPKKKKAYRYVVYYKPKGVITHSPSEDEVDIREALIDNSELVGLFPIGRLDKASSGLIILTDDGRITDRLLNPDKEHDKEYRVRTTQRLRDSFKKHMEAGVEIEGYTTKPAKIRLVNDNTFFITLTEGKRHQIRRMVVAMHNEVAELVRTRILNIKQAGLKPGEYRVIQGDELQEFLEKLSLA